MSTNVRNHAQMLEELLNFVCDVEDELNRLNPNTQQGQDTIVFHYNLLMAPKNTWATKNATANNYAAAAKVSTKGQFLLPLQGEDENDPCETAAERKHYADKKKAK